MLTTLTKHTQDKEDDPHSRQSVNDLDVVIVFGEGPIKPVLLENELTEKQKDHWRRYRNDPVHTSEPSFWLMQQPRQLATLTKAKNNQEVIRNDWQHNGWFSLKKWGRQNALAAGSALYSGKTEKIILSGGKTIAGWVKKSLPQERVDRWPTEAELMKDIIVKYYGDLYFKRYHRKIDVAIILETEAKNTLENFAFCINRLPQIVTGKLKVGFLSAQHHLKRLKILAQRFSINNDPDACFDSQIASKDCPVDLPEIKNIEDIKSYTIWENRWLNGLENPDYLTYWLGYIGLVKSPIVIQNTINFLKNPLWVNAAKNAFRKIDFNFDRYLKTDIVNLSHENPAEYGLLCDSLKKLSSPALRRLPNET